jgi:molecular chaperone DnaK (HSP70)
MDPTKMKKIADTSPGESVTNAVITVPDYFALGIRQPQTLKLLLVS